MLAMVTGVLGVRGGAGNLEICPKLVKEQFDQQDQARLELRFAGKKFWVVTCNPYKMAYREYRIEWAACDGEQIPAGGKSVVLARGWILKMTDEVHQVEIRLGSL